MGAALAAGMVWAGPVAKIGDWNGAPAILVDGKPVPPMAVTLAYTSEDRAAEVGYFRNLGAAGIRLFYVYCWTDWRMPNGVELSRERIRRIADAVPEAYFIIRLTIAPPIDWVNAHPEEMVTFSDGKPRKAFCSTVSRKKAADGMHSLCSEKWREEGMKAIAEFYDRLDATPEGARVIGTFIAAGGTSEWYYPTCLRQTDGACGDFSEPFRREYERFLRARYGTVDALRAAWRDPTATFERPRIATFAESDVVGDTDLIREIGVKSGKMTSELAKARAPQRTTFGDFIDMTNCLHVADMYDAWHEATARTIVHFARGLKRIRPNRLVGAFYGSAAQTSLYDFGTVTGVRTILDSGVVDFLAAPPVYKNRNLGGATTGREIQDSLRLRNMLFVSEDDVRTHLVVSPRVRAEGDLHTAAATVNVLKRDFARDICEDTHGWWFDMGHRTETTGWWYNDPAIFSLFAEQQAIAREAYASGRAKRNEVALVADTDSLHLVKEKLSLDVLDLWRTTDLGRLGLGVDWYWHDDLANPKTPDYRLYVMLNVYHLTDAEREAVYAKARRNGATVLWLYAPGFANREAEERLSAAGVSKTVGLNVVCEEREVSSRLTLEQVDSPYLAQAPRDRVYGEFGRKLHATEEQDIPAPVPMRTNPTFTVVDPKATVLGRRVADGGVALAATERDGVKVVYSTSPVLEAELLGSIAEAAGCHRYSRRGDTLYANERYLAVHADGSGRRTIRLKRRCTPYEVYEKRAYGENVDTIEVDLDHGETKMWIFR